MTSNTEKSEMTDQFPEKSTSSRRRRGNEATKLPKAARLKPKLDPIEHCSVTRGMVLEQNEKLGNHIADYNDTKNTVRWQTSEILNIKVVRAWPIYTAIVLEAAAIAYLGAKLFGYLG